MDRFDRRAEPPTCDVCPQPATIVRPATRNRELAFYCAYDAKLGLGWGDTFRPIEDADWLAAPGEAG